MPAQIDRPYFKTSPIGALRRLVSWALFEGRPLTTRGRWINPLVFALFALARRLPQLRRVDRPLFIVGTGRSGTTVLGTVLSLHRRVGFLNEPKALWHTVLPDEDLIGSYTTHPARYRLDASAASPEVRRTAHRLYGAYLRTAGSRRVLDKYPEMIFRTPFVRAIFEDARFLFLVRNGWDTCHSVARWSTCFGARGMDDKEDWWGANDRKWKLMVDQLVSTDPELARSLETIRTFERNTDRAAVEWILTMRQGLELQRSIPGVIHLVRYEDLTNQPVETLRGILSFCELPDDPRVFQYGARKLSPTPAREPIHLHPCLRSTFHQTMEALDYGTATPPTS